MKKTEMNNDQRVRSFSPAFVSMLLILMDLIGVAASFLIAYYIRMMLGEQSAVLLPLARGVDFYLNYWPILTLWLLVFWREGLYPGLWMTSDEELRRVIEGTSLASLLVIMLTFVTQTGEVFSRPILVGWWALTLILIPFNRIGLKYVLSFTDIGGPAAVILGVNPISVQIIKGLRQHSLPPFRPLGIFHNKDEPMGEEFLGLPVLGDIEEAFTWGGRRGVDTAVVVLPDMAGDQLVTLTEALGAAYRRVVVIPDLIGLSTAETDVRDMEGLLALEVRRNLLLWHARALKRFVDLVISITVLVLFSPLILLISLLLALEGEGPVFYAQARIGLHGETFTAWKFRTMVADADHALQTALERDAQLRAEWDQQRKLKHDPRLTALGSVLRRFSLDELPQLWNILKGEMSLVGPRPIVREEIEKYGAAIDLYYRVRPGLTGLWQVSGRSDLSYQERVRLDTYYVRNWSIWLDLVIILRTFLAVLLGRGAY